MAKFILEVSDEYIREQADSEKMADRLAESKGGMDALDSLLNVIAFNSIKDAIDEGTTEFTFSVDDMGDDEKGRDIFYHIVRRVPMLNVIKEGKKKKDKEEQK